MNTRSSYVTWGGLAATAVLFCLWIWPTTAPGAFPLKGYPLVGGREHMRLYIVDTHGNSAKGAIRVFDLADDRLLDSIPARYNPEIALSADGKILFVLDSEIGGNGDSSELRVYDASSFSLVSRIAVPHHPIYNVFPISAGIVLSRDGRLIFLLQMDQIDGGKAAYDIAAIDVQKASLLPHKVKLPENASFISRLPFTQSGLFLLLQGAEMEAVSWTEPLKEDELDKVYAFDHPSERDMGFMIAQVVISPDGSSIYLITRNGRLRVAENQSHKIGPEIPLRIPADCSIPLGDPAVVENTILVGVSTKNDAAQGMIDDVYTFDRKTFQLIRTIHLASPALHMAVSADGSELYASSYTEGLFTTYDVKSGRPVAEIHNAAETLVWFDVAPSP